MRFKNEKIAPIWGVAGFCGLILSGCGPKEQVVTTPVDTVIVNNPTPEPGKIIVEKKAPEVIVKPGATKASTTTTTKTETTTKTSDNPPATPPVRAENGDSKMAPAKKTPTPVKKEAALPEPATSKENSSPPKKLASIPKDATSLIVEDIKVGSGKRAEPGATLDMIYTGALTDGTVFDSNAESGQPFSFMLGGGQVIKGWDNGLVGMKVGGKRRLIIPPDMGYGEQGSPPKIPGGATLVFTVELKNVQ